jgi:hypothetical protein
LHKTPIFKKRGAVNPGVRGSYPTGRQNEVKNRCTVLKRIENGLKAPRRGMEFAPIDRIEKTILHLLEQKLLYRECSKYSLPDQEFGCMLIS